ncbi:MAG: hypothetical protein K0Q73_6648 [Paenibacillus sp.]|nr:hypothetical protein [Paenibacillus sp.]
MKRSLFKLFSIVTLAVSTLTVPLVSLAEEVSKVDVSSIKQENNKEIDIQNEIRLRNDLGFNTDINHVKSVASASDNQYGIYLNAEEKIELEKRLEIQKIKLPEIKSYLKQTTIDAVYAAVTEDIFGGLFIDQKSGGIVNIGFKDDINIDKIKKDIINIIGDTKRVKFFKAIYSEKELKAIHLKIDELAQSNQSNEFKILSVNTDIKNQRIEVGIQTYNPTTSKYAQELINNEAVVVIEAQENKDMSRSAYTRPLEGGLEIYTYNGTCTGAFSAYDSTGYYYITAGHCGSIGNSVGQGNAIIGNITKRSYGAYSDAAAIAISPNDASWYLYLNSSRASNFNSHEGYNADNVGDYVCKSGRTTGFDCGFIQSVDYSGFWGITYFTDIRTASFQSQPGDSGSPVFTGQTIKGVLKGTAGSYAAYSHISWVMSNLSITPLH